MAASLLPGSLLSQSHLEKATILYHQSDYWDALELLNARTFSGQEKAESLLLKNRCYLQVQQIDEAQSALDQLKNSNLTDTLLFHYQWQLIETAIASGALESADSIIQTSNFSAKEDIWKARFITSLGSLWLETENYQAAIDTLHSAIQLLGQNPDLLKALQHQALAYKRLNQSDTAMVLYQQSLDLADQVLVKKHHFKAISLNQIGLLHLQKGAASLAAPPLLEALEVFEYRFGERHPSFGTLYNNMGIVYVRSGDLLRSLIYFEKALSVKQEQLEADDPSLANTHLNIGSVALNCLQHEKALTHLKEALAIRQKNDLQNSLRTALVYQLLGQAARELKQADLALAYLDTCYWIRKDLVAPNDPSIAQTYQKMTTVHLSKNDYKSALAFATNTLAIYQDNPPRFTGNLAEAYVHMAEIQNQLGNYEAAQTNIQQAQAALEMYWQGNVPMAGNRNYLLEVLIKKAQLLEQEGGSSLKAIEAYEDAHQLYSHMRQDMGDERGRLFLKSSHYPLYEGMIRIYFERWENNRDPSELENAFAWAERSKGSLLLDAMKASQAEQFYTIPDSLVLLENRLRDSIAQLEKAVYFNSEDKVVNARLFETKEQYASLLEEFQQQYPDYYQARFNQQPIPLETLQDALSEDQALLEYFYGETDVFVFTIQKSGIKAKRFPVPDQFYQQVVDLRKGISGYWELQDPTPSDYERYSRMYCDQAFQIYEAFIQPLGPLPENLIIIPDGPLWYIPFEVLLTQKPEDSARFKSHAYFINSHQHSYAISAQWWLELEEKPSNNGSLVALAPSFDNLNFNEEEARTIARLTGGQAMLGSQANLDWFITYGKQFSYIHFSSHAQLDDVYGDYCFLEFGAPRDRLYVRDLYNLSLPLEMVVLSACNTGAGQFEQGEGLINLSRAFAYAGAKSIITSSWEVDDRTSIYLMQNFYKSLSKGLSKPEALANAKRNYLTSQREDRLASPHFWGTYIVLGNVQPIQWQRNAIFKHLVLALSIILLVFFFRLLEKKKSGHMP